MAIPSAIPSSQVILQTGNGENLLTWPIISGATSYSVERATDGVTFTVVGTPASASYLDTTVVVGTNYYYMVAAVNGSGPSAYTASAPTSITPCLPGNINLGYLRYQAQLRSDLLNSNFITTDEWNIQINQSARELYGLLVQKFGEDYFLAPPLIITSSSLSAYTLPNGSNYSGAPACFKVYGMDLNSYGAQTSNPQGWRSMSRFNWADRNKCNFLLGAASNNVAGQYCQFQYREMGNQVYILPVNSGQNFRLWYVPLAPDLLLDTDMLPYSFSGWYEYVVCDAAAKSLAKQQFFDQAQDLMGKKMALLERIETEAANRDVGMPNCATNSRAMLGDMNFGGGQGFGWGGGGGYGY